MLDGVLASAVVVAHTERLICARVVYSVVVFVLVVLSDGWQNKCRALLFSEKRNLHYLSRASFTVARTMDTRNGWMDGCECVVCVRQEVLRSLRWRAQIKMAVCAIRFCLEFVATLIKCTNE